MRIVLGADCAWHNSGNTTGNITILLKSDLVNKIACYSRYRHINLLYKIVSIVLVVPTVLLATTFNTVYLY